MMRFFIEYNCAPLKGELVYRAHEYSFDFKVESELDIARRAGDKGTISVLVGTLQIEVGIETGSALFIWGLHSHNTQWRREGLPLVPSEEGCFRVQFDEQPVRGVSQGLAGVGEWGTTYDAKTGLICVSSREGDLGKSYVEFAQDTIAGVTNEKLVSLWLRPRWDQERLKLK
jgi:hypothetical protein